jgi:hypothetical protein
VNQVDESPLLPDPSIRDPLESFRSLRTRLARLLGEYGFRLNRMLPKDGTETMTQPLRVASFTTAGRPAAASWPGGIIFVSDAAAGAKFQGSDGTAWVPLG